MSHLINLDAEQALLGALLTSRGRAVLQVQDVVSSEHFSEDIHRLIYDAAVQLAREGREVGFGTILPLLPAEQQIGDLTLRQYLARLIADTTTVINAPDYAAAVRDAWLLRQADFVAEDIRNLAASLPAGMSADTLLADAADRFRMLSIADTSSRSIPVQQAVADAYRNAGSRGITTGLKDLDAKTGGLRPGELVLIGARPGMGKTSFGWRIARAAAEAGYGVGFFSQEMKYEAIGQRAATELAYDRHGSIPYFEIANGSDAYAGAMEEVLPRFGSLPLEIDDRSSLTPAKLEAAARRMRADFARRGITLGVLVVDYLQLMKAGDRYRGDRNNEVSELSAAMKALAKDLGVAVVLLSQLSRGPEARPDKRPMLSDLRDSGSIEQDADTVIFLYREAYYLGKNEETDPDKEAKRLDALQRYGHILEAIIAKQRNGPTGTVKLFYDAPSSAIRDLAKQLPGFRFDDLKRPAPNWGAS